MSADLVRHARERPDHVAFAVAGGGRRTFAELDERSRRLAAALRGRGVGNGEVVAVVLENVVEWAEVVWAGLRSGLRVAPLNHHLPPADLRRVLAFADPSAIVVSAGCAAAVDAALAGARPGPVGGGGSASRPPLRIAVGGPADGGAIALEDLLAEDHAPAPERAGARLVYTSGTTGTPKAIREQLPDGDEPPLRLGPLMERVGIDADAIVLSPGPVHHSAPFGFTTSTQRLGGTAVTMARFDADACARAVQDEGVTHLHLVPTMLHRMLRDPRGTAGRLRAAPTLRGVILGGGACAAGLKAEALDVLGEIVHEYYGASEGYGQTYAGPADARARPGTVGRSVGGTIHVTDPADGRELGPGEVGRVWMAGRSPVTYDGDVDRTAAARDDRGWSTVGDLGHVDVDGYLWLDGRESQVVVTGGVNVLPQHAEDALLAHPAVADATAFGVPDEEWGERLVALVRPAADGTTMGGQGVGGDAGRAVGLVAVLREHLRTALAGPARPREIRLAADVPRTPGGKVDVAAARRAFAAAPPTT